MRHINESVSERELMRKRKRKGEGEKGRGSEGVGGGEVRNCSLYFAVATKSDTNVDLYPPILEREENYKED